MNGFLIRVVLTLVGTALYLGLVVLGEGGVDAVLARPPVATVVIATIVTAVVALFSKGNLSPGEKEGQSNRWFLGPVVVLGFAGAYLPAYTDRIGFWTFGGEGVRWLGVALFVGGTVLRTWPVFVLGRRFSGLVAIQPGHELVTTGMYAAIRNPSYLGLLVQGIGWGLTFRSVVGVLLTAPWVPMLVVRMRSEEQLLNAHFGAAYDAYRARTRRLIPGLY